MKNIKKNKFIVITFITAALISFFLQSNFIPSAESAPKISGFDWPQWRGLNRDGISIETGILKQWPETGPEVVWRRSIGDGYSGISVSNGKLFTMWEEGKSQFLFCLDPIKGKELWRLKIGDNFKSSWGHGPRSTPVIDNTIVYAISAQGLLHAVNVEIGKVLWTHNLNTEYGGQNLVYGYSSSPLVDGNKLFVEVGGKEEFAFVALNKTTGELLWNSQTDLQSYSSPIAVTMNETRQIVFLSAEGLFSVSPDDGSLYWQYPWNARCPSTGIPVNVNTPVFIAPDKIFISGAYGTITGGAIVQSHKNNDQFKPETLWNNGEMKNLINSSIYIENHIYGFDDSTLKCIDASTGIEKWKTRGFQRGSLIAVDGHLIVLGERGNLALIEATPLKYKEIARAQIFNSDRNWTAPSMANGKLYLRNHEEIICLNMRDI